MKSWYWEIEDYIELHDDIIYENETRMTKMIFLLSFSHAQTKLNWNKSKIVLCNMHCLTEMVIIDFPKAWSDKAIARLKPNYPTFLL